MAYPAPASEFRVWGERLAERDQLQRRLAGLRIELDKETEVRDTLAMLVRAEQEDVRELSEPSFKRFLIRLRGELDQTFGRELIEVEEARQSHSARARMVLALEERVSDTAGRLEALRNVDAGYADALARQAALLTESDPDLREQCSALDTRLVQARRTRALLDETLALGSELLRALDHALRAFNLVERCGPVETGEPGEPGERGTVVPTPLQMQMEAGAQALANAQTLLPKLASGLQNVTDAAVASVASPSWPNAFREATGLGELPPGPQIGATPSDVSGARIRVRVVLTRLERVRTEHAAEHDRICTAYEALVRRL